MKAKKIELAKHLFAKYGHLFACPICTCPMGVGEETSLRCFNNHSFDLARQGYVNLLAGGGKSSRYDSKLFTARLALAREGFFINLQRAIESLIVQFTPNLTEDAPLVLIDMGCGEGSHLAYIKSGLSQALQARPVGIGLDIAKSGIRLAAATYENIIWCVADIAQAPLKSGSCHVLLNILSPANYLEFKRLLCADGIAIKVFPGAQYLQELRSAIYTGGPRETYDNSDSAELFPRHFRLLASRELRYEQKLTATQLNYLLQMTPLTWDALPRQLQEVRKKGLDTITIHFNIMVGKKTD